MNLDIWGLVKSVYDLVIAGGAGDLAAIKAILDTLGSVVIEGSVSDAAPAVTDFDTDLTETTDDHYKGMVLMFTNGVCADQAHVIDSYTGATKNVAFSAEDRWTDAPADGDDFIILPDIGTMAKAIFSRIGAPAGATISADIANLITSYLGHGTHGLAALDTDLGTILTRLSAARAGYLDNLSAGAVALASVCTAARLGELGPANIPADIDTLLARLTATRAGYLDELAAANLPADIDTLLTRVTAAVALASVCTEARLAELGAANIPADIDTLLTRLTAARAVYLDELAAANIPLDLGTLLTRLSAARAGYLDNLSAGAAALASVCTAARLGELDPANIPADINTLLSRVTAAVALASVCTEARLAELAAANLPADIDTLKAGVVSYFEQTVPIKMNCTQTITATKGDKVFIAANATGASGLISTDDTKVMKVFLLIIGRVVNVHAGTNALDCSAADGTPADNNQWQMDLDNGGFADLTNEEADGQMLDNDWRTPVEGGIHPFTLMFDVDTELTNIDGKIGVQLKDARSEQASLIVTCDIYLKIMWKL